MWYKFQIGTWWQAYYCKLCNLQCFSTVWWIYRMTGAKGIQTQAHRWWSGLRWNHCVITQLVVVYTKSEEKVSQIPGCNCPSPFKSSILKLSVSHGSEKQPEPADWWPLVLLLPRNPGYRHYHSRQSSTVGDGDEEISGACGASGNSCHPQSWSRSQRRSHSHSPNQSCSRKRGG